MPYYELKEDSQKVAMQIIQNIQFQGSETFQLLELLKGIQNTTKAPYYELEEELVKFFLEKINKSSFTGSAVIMISKLIIALNKPIKELPKETTNPMPPPAPPPALNKTKKLPKTNQNETKADQTSQKPSEAS
jgi:hypothetical protein